MADDFHSTPSHTQKGIPSFGPQHYAMPGTERGICRDFNRTEACSQSQCKYCHVCNRCYGEHARNTCPGDERARRKEKKSFTQPEAIASPSKQNTSIINPLTPIFVSKLEDFLADHPDPTLVSQLCTNLGVGARIGFEGQRTPRFSKNLPTALNQPSIVTSNLEHEVSLGRAAGPFETPPFPNFQVSPIGLVPKKNSKKFRTIFHLSFPKSDSTSINASISKDDFSLQYVTIDTAIQGIKRFGHDCFLAKTDIESAFRLIPVHPDDYELLGMYWEGKYYYDKVLPFGLRSGPYLFNQLSDTIEWILQNKCMISFVCHILDDFLIMELPSELTPHDSACQQSLTAMMLAFKILNIPVAPNKTQGPATVLEFMGIILDSVRMEARLPADKIERLYVLPLLHLKQGNHVT